MLDAVDADVVLVVWMRTVTTTEPAAIVSDSSPIATPSEVESEDLSDSVLAGVQDEYSAEIVKEVVIVFRSTASGKAGGNGEVGGGGEGKGGEGGGEGGGGAGGGGDGGGGSVGGGGDGSGEVGTGGGGDDG